MKTNTYFVSFTQFVSMKPIQLLKTYEYEFLHEKYQQQVYAVV